MELYRSVCAGQGIYESPSPHVLLRCLSPLSSSPHQLHSTFVSVLLYIDHILDTQSSFIMSSVPAPLSTAWGYGIILGLGALFALGMVLVTWILKRYNNELQTSEMFSTAGRTVKSGLVASAVVSSWTWAATLLQSTSIAYRYGVSGPFWYASGATVQILLFASIAIELKRRAPNAHVSVLPFRSSFQSLTIYRHSWKLSRLDMERPLTWSLQSSDS